MRVRLCALAVFVAAMLLMSGVLYAQAAGLQPGDSIGAMSLRSGGRSYRYGPLLAGVSQPGCHH
jgi:hypothetical protein